MQGESIILPVTLENGKVVWAEAVPLTSEQDVASTIFSFEGVFDTIEELATRLNATLSRVKPRKAAVEFGLSLAAESGKLTALIVKGSGAANVKVTLEWGD